MNKINLIITILSLSISCSFISAKGDLNKTLQDYYKNIKEVKEEETQDEYNEKTYTIKAQLPGDKVLTCSKFETEALGEIMKCHIVQGKSLNILDTLNYQQALAAFEVLNNKLEDQKINLEHVRKGEIPLNNLKHRQGA